MDSVFDVSDHQVSQRAHIRRHQRDPTSAHDLQTFNQSACGGHGWREAMIGTRDLQQFPLSFTMIAGPIAMIATRHAVLMTSTRASASSAAQRKPACSS